MQFQKYKGHILSSKNFPSLSNTIWKRAKHQAEMRNGETMRFWATHAGCFRHLHGLRHWTIMLGTSSDWGLCTWISLNYPCAQEVYQKQRLCVCTQTQSTKQYIQSAAYFILLFQKIFYPPFLCVCGCLSACLSVCLRYIWIFVMWPPEHWKSEGNLRCQPLPF